MSGTVVGTTTDPLTYTTQGTFTITWTYDDGNGNISTQMQTVIVDDVTAPVPDVATLCCLMLLANALLQLAFQPQQTIVLERWLELRPTH
ncbi:MAG: hypothetical protein R2788_06760 [Saprospiraceae bacterium]